MSKNQKELLIRPLLTEKMTGLSESRNQFAFEVVKRANKIQIKSAVEKQFDVTVLSVRTMIMPGKKRRMGRFEGKRPSWKKAVVSLKEGDVIDYTGVTG